MRRLALVLALTAALLAAPACSSDDDGKVPAASVTSVPESTTTTETLTPEQEVERAYLRSWDVYAKAVRELDPSGLEESYTGDALETVRKEVEGYAAADTPLIVRVEHSVTVGVVRPGVALVHDKYINRNYRTNAQGDPLDDPNDPGTYEDRYQLDRVRGAWLVSRIERLSYQP